MTAIYIQQVALKALPPAHCALWCCCCAVLRYACAEDRWVAGQHYQPFNPRGSGARRRRDRDRVLWYVWSLLHL